MKYVVKKYHDQTIAKYKRTLFGLGRSVKIYYFNEGKTDLVVKYPYNKETVAKIEKEMEKQMESFVLDHKDILERNTILDQNNTINVKTLKPFDADVQKYALYIAAKKNKDFDITAEEKKVAGLKEPKFNVNTIDNTKYTEILNQINYIQKVRDIIAYNKKNICSNISTVGTGSKVKTK